MSFARLALPTAKNFQCFCQITRGLLLFVAIDVKQIAILKSGPTDVLTWVPVFGNDHTYIYFIRSLKLAPGHCKDFDKKKKDFDTI